MGVVAPAGLAPGVESQLANAWRRMAANTGLQQTLEARAVEVTFRNGAEFGQFMREDRRFWASAIATAKIRLD